MKKQNDEVLNQDQKEKKPKLNKWIKIAIAILGALLSLVIISVSTVFIMYISGKSNLTENNDIVISTPDTDLNVEIDDSGKTVTYNGKKYIYNDNITTVLFLGIDKTDVDSTSNFIGKNGQADALYLAIIDTDIGKMNFLSISRDTITDVSIYSQTGKYVGIKKLPICAAYAYGDGKKSSCENTATALSRLLYGIPVNRYITFDMSCVSSITNYVDGVEVPKYNSDFTEQIGEKITVSGKSALKYVRYRDKTVTGSNDSRLERQRYFLKSLGNKILSSTKKDIGYPLKIFNMLKADMVTNLTAADVTFLASVGVKINGDPIFRSVEGKMVEGENYDELHIDSERLYKQVLELFYIEQ